MQWFLLSLCLVFVVPPAYSNTFSASLELNDYTFDKILKKFDATLVKFDVAFPYGDKHDAYTALAKDAKNEDDLLIAEVGVKDYGEKDNEELARKYGATKDNFPVVKLFLKGKKEPIAFNPEKEFTSDALRRFVREHTGVHLSLPGCVRSLDKLAVKFMKADKEDRKGILKDNEDTFKKLPSQGTVSIKYIGAAKVLKHALYRLDNRGVVQMFVTTLAAPIYLMATVQHWLNYLKNYANMNNPQDFWIQQSNSGKIYKTIMEKIIEKGDGFVKTEHDRITKLLSTKLSEEKKKEMGQRINILQTFQLYEKTKANEEL